MKSILKSTAVNGWCVSLFTAFYAFIFIMTSRRQMEFEDLLYYNKAAGNYNFWTGWSDFLANGYHVYIAYALIVITMIIVLMLFSRRRPYDEYHVANLIQCLVVAIILTLMAIALFYIMVLIAPNGIVEKFTLFIVIHWTTVVLADLAFVFLCRWR